MMSFAANASVVSWQMRPNMPCQHASSEQVKKRPLERQEVLYKIHARWRLLRPLVPAIMRYGGLSRKLRHS